MLFCLIFLVLFFLIPNDEIYYIEDAFPAHLFAMIQECTKNINYITEDNPYVRNRFFSPIYDIDHLVYHQSITDRIAHLLNKQIKPCTHNPIECRLYTVGSYMDWHRDDVLYFPPQYECILTLENSSDSRTEYEDIWGNVHSIATKPNSLLIVRGNGIKHRVTEMSRGQRKILKYIYATSPSLRAYGLS